MTNRRTYLISKTNNEENPNKTLCLLACAKTLHMENLTTYLHTPADLMRVVRKHYSVMRVTGCKHKTVGSVRDTLAATGCTTYLIHVMGHVMLLSRDGTTIVDSDPRKRDRRKILHIWGISNKCF